MFYSSAALTQSLYLFVEIQNTVSSLQSTSTNIQLELTAAQKNLTDAQDSCKNSGGGNTCDEIPVGNELTTDANFTKVSNMVDLFLFLVNKNYIIERFITIYKITELLHVLSVVTTHWPV